MGKWNFPPITQKMVDAVNKEVELEHQRLEEDVDDIDLANDELNYANHIREELAQYFDVDLEDVSFIDGHLYDVNGDEYWVGTYEEALIEALEQARETLDELGLEALTPDYKDYVIENYLDEDSCDDIMREYYEGYVNDIEDESDDEFPNRLIRELYEADIINDEYFEKDEDDNVDYSTLEGSIDLESKKEALVDYLVDNMNAYQFLEDMFGNGQELSKFIEENNLIDLDDVAQDCVDTDGVGHFLARYDGKELEIRDDLFAYKQ